MIEYRLSREIATGARAIPRYNTDIIPTDGGYEFRNSLWSYPLFRFEFDVEPGDPNGDNTLEELINLYHAAGGAFRTFRFRHWTDYDATNQIIASAGASQTQFQLYRIYQRANVQRQRKITRPVTGTVTVYADDVPISGTTDYDTGIFTADSAPTPGAKISADFQFDVPVRFENDELEVLGLMVDIDQPVNIVLMEVRE